MPAQERLIVTESFMEYKLSQNPEQPKDDNGLLEAAHCLLGSGLRWGRLWEFLGNVPGGRSVVLGHALQCDVESDSPCPCMDLSARFLHPSAPAAHGVVRHGGPGLSNMRSWTT